MSSAGEFDFRFRIRESVVYLGLSALELARVNVPFGSVINLIFQA